MRIGSREEFLTEDRSGELTKGSGSGLFYLFLGKVIADFVASISSIVVARLLGADAYGIAGIAVIPVETFGLLSDIGVGAAITRFSAFYRSRDDNKEALSYVRTGVSTQILIGLLLSVAAFLSAPLLAEHVFRRPELSPLFQVASPFLFVNSVLTSSQAAFIGFGRMTLYSGTLITQSVLKTSLGPLLVIMGYGAFGVVSANVLSAAATSVLSLVLVYTRLTQTSKSLGSQARSLEKLRMMVSYGFPLFVSVVLSGMSTQIYKFLMAMYCSESSIGNYLAASKFSVLIAFFTMPIATVLFPAFSSIDRHLDSDSLRKVYRDSVKYTGLTALPVVSILAVLSSPLILLLFGEGYSEAPLFLTLFALSSVFVGLGPLSISSLFNGQGMTKSTMMLNLIGLLTGIPLAFYLIPKLQIVGLLTTGILVQIPAVIVANLWLRRSFGFGLNWNSAVRIYVSALLSSLIVFFVQQKLPAAGGMLFFLGAALFVVLYLFSLIILRAVTEDDLRTLGSLFSGLGPISSLIAFGLRLGSRLVNALQRS